MGRRHCPSAAEVEKRNAIRPPINSSSLKLKQPTKLDKAVRLNTAPSKCVNLKWENNRLSHLAKNVGISGGVAPGRITEMLEARAWQEEEALGSSGDTRQSSRGPYPRLLYLPATDEVSPKGKEAFAGRGVGDGEGELSDRFLNLPTRV